MVAFTHIVACEHLFHKIEYSNVLLKFSSGEPLLNISNDLCFEVFYLQLGLIGTVQWRLKFVGQQEISLLTTLHYHTLVNRDCSVRSTCDPYY